MLPSTIATSVAPETITKVGRLFNGSVTDILHELLQNARRAEASCITIMTTGRPGDRLLHIVDDGHGIADPASIVTLGRSGWSDGTARREDPAGMGVFSLAGRDVIMRSWSRPEHQGWCAHIPAAAWESSRPIAISPDPIGRGTAITVRMPSTWDNEVVSAVGHVARYYPLPVNFDGAAIERQAWLDEAVHVEDWNGCRIGVVKEYGCRRGDPRLNFHGVTIPCRMPEVSEVDRGEHWAVRIDIVDCPEIQLVLPARKEAVQNDALDALRAAARTIIYRAIARIGSHRLAHKDWLDALDLGIDLPEATCHLYGWCPPHAAPGESYMSGDRIADPAMVIMADVEAIIAQPASRAIDRHQPFAGPLVFAEDKFAGYDWYDRLARVEALAFAVEQDGRGFRIAETKGAPADADNGYVDRLTLEATLLQAGVTRTVSCEADIAFALDHELSDYIDDLAIFVLRDVELAPPDAIDLLERAAFAPSSDSDADSFDTQRTRFRRDATDRILSLLEGTDAALETRIRALLDVYPWLVPADRTVTIRMTREALDVAIVERQTEAG